MSPSKDWLNDEIERAKNKDVFDSIVFEETPVSLEKWLYDEDYLGIEALSPKQYDAVLHGVQIYREEERKTLGENSVRQVDELVVEWGKGGGKDFVSALIVSTITYRLLCLKSPQQYYRQSKVSHIDLLNMAYSGGQATDTYFAYLRDMVKSAKWFRGKFKITGEARIVFPKNIRAFSGNSFEESFEGKNLFVCVLDEIAAFKSDSELEQLMSRRVRAPRWSASAVYDMAQTSIASRFGNRGKLISISFPRYKGDFIQELYEKRKDDAQAFVSFGATWEVNPTVTRESLDNEYRRNPERAKARYECMPSAILDSFIKKPELIDECFKCVDSMADIGLTDDYAPKMLESLKSLHKVDCAMHMDVGWKKDSCGIALAHCSGVEIVNDNSEGRIELPSVEVDLVTSFIAPINGEIDFETVRGFVVDLINRGYNIRKITLDGYNSAYFMQTFSKLGIETELRSIDRDTAAYDDVKELLYGKRIKGVCAARTIYIQGVPRQKYIVVEELKGLIVAAGAKVDHRTGGVGKDESDALAGAVQGALEMGYSSFSPNDIVTGKDRETAVMEQDREYLSPSLDREFM